MKEKILDIFYNQIVNEAKTGKVDCYFYMNIIFNLVIDNNVITNSNNDTNGILIPTIKITNKELFDKLLVEYVVKAMNFYDKDNFAFLNDLDNEVKDNAGTIKETYFIKYIICSLLANASYSDFDNFNNFLETRISMFDNQILDTSDEINFGHINSIGANICAKEEKSPIRAETPYRIKGYLQFDDGYKLDIPDIYAASDGEKYYLYGIQNTSKGNKEEEKSYLKQIRKGLIAKINGSPEHYFIASMLFLSLCNDKKIECVPFLVERWNAKRMNIYDMSKVRNIDIDEKISEQEYIQGNITNKLIQYFTKLFDVCNGLEIECVPFEIDDKLHMNINSNFESRSIAFNEIYELSSKNKNDNIKL